MTNNTTSISQDPEMAWKQRNINNELAALLAQDEIRRRLAVSKNVDQIMRKTN